MKEQKIQRPSTNETRNFVKIVDEILEESRCYLSIRFEMLCLLTFLSLWIIIIHKHIVIT